MKVKKGDLEYHISYGLHSNIPKCCIIYWLTEFDVYHNELLRRKYKMDCGYIPCIECIKKQRSNKIVHCEFHRKSCCFLPKGRDWKKGPPNRITLTKELEKATMRFKKKYEL